MPDIWVLGDSIPYWAGKRAADTGKINLGLPDQTRIGWWGKRGLQWDGFRQSIGAATLLNVPPKLVLIHLGGNDIISKPLTYIFNAIQREVRYLRTSLPETVLVWINILPRRFWGNEHYSPDTVETKLKRVNRWGRQQVNLHPRSFALAMDIDTQTPGFYRSDGVHLSDVGLEFYLDYMKDVCLKYL